MIVGRAQRDETRLDEAHSKALHSFLTSSTETQHREIIFAAQQHNNFPNNRNHQVQHIVIQIRFDCPTLPPDSPSKAYSSYRVRQQVEYAGTVEQYYSL